MAQFFKGVQSLKLKDTVPYVRKYAADHWTPAKLQARVSDGVQDYKVKYIDTGSSKPLKDVMIYGFFLFYAIAWPNEYRHLKHAEASKLKGEEQPMVAV